MNQNKQEIIKLTPPKPAQTKITIEGITSLIVSRRTPEGIKPKASAKKEENEAFRESLYPKTNGHHTIPSRMIVRAAIDAAHTFATSITKTRARGIFDIPMDWIELKADEPEMRKDIGCNPNKRGAAIEIIRAEFKKWRATFPIEYDVNAPLTLEQIINLINIAGYYVGIGAWRPSKNGIHGRFKVIETK